jgi:DNA gyrase/topoisomerase IV subunit A
MKTSVDIPENMLNELLKNTNAESKRQAIMIAIDEYNRRKRMREIVESLGTFKDFMDGSELDTMRSEP